MRVQILLDPNEYKSFKERIMRIVEYSETYKQNGQDKLAQLIDSEFGDTDKYNKGGGRILLSTDLPTG